MSFFFPLLNCSLPGSLIAASVCLCHSFSSGSCVGTGERLPRQEPSSPGSHRAPLPMGRPRPPWKPWYQYQEPFLALTHPLSGFLTLLSCFRFHPSVSDLLSGPNLKNKQTKQTKQNLSSLITASQLLSEFPVPTAVKVSKSVTRNCHHCFFTSFSLLQPLVLRVPSPPLHKQLLARLPASSCFPASGPLCLPLSPISPHDAIHPSERCSLHPLQSTWLPGCSSPLVLWGSKAPGVSP